MSNAANLIAESVATNSIVRAPYSTEKAIDLYIECDDSADTPEEVEYWGTDEDGAEWRVHLTYPGEL